MPWASITGYTAYMPGEELIKETSVGDT